MIISMAFRAELRSVKEQEYTKNDGTKGMTYKLGIELPDGDMGQLPCTEDVYKAFGKVVKKGDICNFVCAYNSEYGRIRVTDLTVKA